MPGSHVLIGNRDTALGGDLTLSGGSIFVNGEGRYVRIEGINGGVLESSAGTDRWLIIRGNRSATGVEIDFQTHDASSVDTSRIQINGFLATATITVQNSVLDFNTGALSGTPGTTGSALDVATSTFTDNNTAASGTAASYSYVALQAPTLAATNLTVTTTHAATLYISGGPIAGTNQTLTNSWSIWAAAASRFDVSVTVFAAAGAAVQTWQRANGTLAAPTAVLNGEAIVDLGFSGYGTSYGRGAELVVNAIENWSGTVRGANLEIGTITAGGTSMVRRIRFEGATISMLNSTALDMGNGIISNIGNAGTDFTSAGGLNIAEDVDIVGQLAVGSDADNTDANVQMYLFHIFTNPGATAKTHFQLYGRRDAADTNLSSAAHTALLIRNWLQMAGSTTETSFSGIQSGINVHAVFDGGTNKTISDMRNFYSTAQPLVASNTVTTLYHFYAANAAGTGLVGTQYGIYIENLTKGGTADYGLYIAGADTEAIFVDAGTCRFDGSIGVGTAVYATQPAGSIGSAGGLMIGASSTNNLFDDASNGGSTTIMYIGNVSITTSSDVRLKTDVRPYHESALALLRRAPQLVSFMWDDPSDRNPWGKNSRGRYLGFLAQETIGWAPWVVNAGAGLGCEKCRRGEPCGEHGYWTVEYQHLVPLVVQGVQEVDRRVTGLEERVLALETALAEAKAELAGIHAGGNGHAYV